MLNQFVYCIFTDTFLIGVVPRANSRSSSRRRRKPTQQPYGITDPTQTHSSEENISSENDSNFSEDSLMCADENVPSLDIMLPIVDEIRNVTHSLEGMTSALMHGDGGQSPELSHGHDLTSGEKFTMLRGVDQTVQDEVRTGRHDDIVPSVSIRRSSKGDTEIAARQENSGDTQGQTRDNMDMVKGTSELGAGQVDSAPGAANRKRQQLVMAQVDVWHTPTETCPASPDQMDQSITGPSERADNGSQVTAGEQPIHPPASKRELVEASRLSEEDVSSTVESNGEEVGDDELSGMPGQIERGRESAEVLSTSSAEVVSRIGDEPSANVALMEYEDPVSLPLAADHTVSQSQHSGHLHSELPSSLSCLQNLQLGLGGQKHSGNSSLPHHSVESGNYNNRMTPRAAVSGLSVDNTTAHTVTELSTQHTTPHAVTETSVDHATPHAVTETSVDHATPHAVTESSVDHATPHAVTETSVDHATPHAVTETSVDHATPHAVTETSVDHATPHAVTETSVDHATPHAVTETSMDHATPHAVTETSVDHATPHAVTETYVDHATPHAVTETYVDHATPHAVTETYVDHARPHAVTETSVDHATPHAVTETSVDHATPHAVTETSVDHATPHAVTETYVDHARPHAVTETSVDHATPHAVTETYVDHATPHAVTETYVDHARPHAVTETSVDHATPHAVTETSVDHATPHAVTETSVDHATPHAITETSMDHATPHAVTETSVDHATPHTVTETSMDHATPHAVTETYVDHATPHAVTETYVDHATPHAVTETYVDHARPHAVTETSVDHATPHAVTETSVDHATPHAVTETSVDHATPHAVTETYVDHARPHAVTETSVDHATPHAVTETYVDHATPHAVTETYVDHARPHAVTETSVDHATPHAVTETSVDHATPHAVTETSVDHATPHAITETSMDHATPHTVTETSMDHATPHAVAETSMDHAIPHAVTETSVDHATPHAVTETSMDHATPHAVTETSMDHATPHAVTETSMDHATPHAVTETSMDHATPHAVTETSMDHATPHAVTETSVDHATPHAVTETSVDHATPHAITETSMDHATPHAVTETSVDHATPHAVTETYVDHATPHAVTETSVDHARPHAITETPVDHATPHAVTETSVDHATPHAVTETSVDHATPHAVTETSMDHATPHAVTETTVDHATPQTVTETSMDHTTPHAVTETSVDHARPYAVTETSVDHATPHAVTETSMDHATPHAVTETSVDHATPHAVTQTYVDHATPHAVTETYMDHATPHAVTETCVDHATPHAVTEKSVDHATPHTVTETSVDHTTPHAVTETSMDHATPHAVTETCVDHAIPHAVTDKSVDYATPHAVTETSVNHATPHAVTETCVDHATPHAVTEKSVDHATPHAVTETSVDHATPHTVTETSVDHTTPHAVTETSVDHATPHAVTETSVDHTTPHAITETSMDHATPHAVTETSMDHATPHVVTETSVDHATPHAVTETSVDHETPHAVTETSVNHATPHAVTETSVDHATAHAVTETSVDHATPHAITETSMDHATPHAVTETSVDHATPHAVTETYVDHATPHAVTETSVDHARPHAITETPVDHATPHAVTETSVDHATPHAVTETSMDHATPHAVTETSMDHATPHAVTETSVDHATPYAVTETSVDHATPHAVTETSVDHATLHAVTETSVDHATPHAVTETSVDHVTPHTVTETSMDHTTYDAQQRQTDVIGKDNTTETPKERKANVRTGHQIPAVDESGSSLGQTPESSGRVTEPTDVCQPTDIVESSGDDASKSTTSGNIESAIGLSDADVMAHLVIDSALSTSNVSDENSGSIHVSENSGLPSGGIVEHQKEASSIIASSHHEDINVGSRTQTDSSDNPASRQVTAVLVSDVRNMRPSLDKPETILTKDEDTTYSGNQQENLSDHSSAEPLPSHSVETIAADPVPATSAIHQDMTIHEPTGDQPSNHNFTTKHGLSRGNEGRSSVTGVLGDNIKAGLCMPWQPVTGSSCISELTTASPNVGGISEQSSVPLTRERSVCGTEPVVDTAESSHTETTGTPLQVIHGDSKFAGKLLPDYSARKQPACAQLQEDPCGSQLDYSTDAREVVVPAASQQHDTPAGRLGGHEESVVVCSLDNVPTIVSDLSAVGRPVVFAEQPCVSDVPERQQPGHLQTPDTDDLCVGDSQGHQSETVLELQESIAVEAGVRQVAAATDNKQPTSDRETDRILTSHQNVIELVASVPRLSQETAVEQMRTALQGNRTEGIVGRVANEGSHLDDICSELYSIHGDGNDTANDTAVTTRHVSVSLDNDEAPGSMADPPVAAGDRASTDDGDTGPRVRTTDRTHADDKGASRNTQSEVAPSAVNRRTGITQRCDISSLPTTTQTSSDQSANNLVKSKLHLQSAHDDEESLFDGSTGDTLLRSSDIDAGRFELVHFKAPELRRRMRRLDEDDDTKKMESLEKSAVVFLMDAAFEELIENVVREGWEYATVADTDGMSRDGYATSDVMDSDGPSRRSNDAETTQDAASDAIMKDTEGSGENAGMKPESNSVPLLRNSATLLRNESNLSMFVNIDEDQVISDDEFDDDNRDSTTVADTIGPSQVDNVVLTQIPERGTDSANPSLVPNIDEEPEEIVEEDIELMHWITGDESRDEDAEDGSGDEAGASQEPVSTRDTRGASSGHPRGAFDRHQDGRPSAYSGDQASGGKKIDSEEAAAVSVSFDDGYCTLLMPSDASLNDSGNVTHVMVQDISTEDTEHDVSFSTLGEVEECAGERTNIQASASSGLGPEGDSFDDVPAHSSPVRHVPNPQDAPWPITTSTCNEEFIPPLDHGSYRLMQCKQPEEGVRGQTEDVVHPLELSQILQMINSEFDELANLVAHEGWEYATVTTTGRTNREASGMEATEGVSNGLTRSLSLFVNTGDTDDQQDDEVDEMTDNVLDRFRLMLDGGNQSKSTSLMTTIGDEPDDIEEEEIEFMQLSDRGIDGESEPCGDTPVDGLHTSDTGDATAITASGQSQQQPGGRSRLKAQPSNATTDINNPDVKRRANAMTEHTAKKTVVLADTKVIGFDIQPDHPYSMSHAPDLQHSILFETQSRYNYFRDDGAPLLMADVQILGVQPPLATPRPRRTRTAPPGDVVRDRPIASCLQHLRYSALNIEIKPLGGERQGGVVVVDGEGVDIDEQDLSGSYHGDTVNRSRPPRSQSLTLIPRRGCVIAGAPVSGGAYIDTAGTSLLDTDDMVVVRPPEGSPDGDQNPDVSADSTESVETVIAVTTEDNETDNRAAAIVPLTPAQLAESARLRLAWMHLFGMPTDDLRLFPRRYNSVETQTSFNSSRSSSSSSPSLDINSGNSEMIEDFQARLLISQFIEESAEIVPPSDDEYTSSDGSQHSLSPGEVDMYSSDTFLSSSSLESIPEALDLEDEPDEQEATEEPWPLTSTLLQSDDENMADTEDNVDQDASNDSITYVFLSHSRSLHEMGLWDDGATPLHRPTSEPTCADDTPRSYAYNHLGLPLKERSVSLNEIQYLLPETLSSGHRSVSLDLSKQMLTEDIAPEDIFGGHFEDAELELSDEGSGTGRRHHKVTTASTSCQVDTCTLGTGSSAELWNIDLDSHPRMVEISSPPNKRKEGTTLGLTETCETTLERPGEIAIRSEVRPGGLQVSNMHITDLVPASLHVETRRPGSYYVSIRGRHRTIETQTYPELRVIETQTSDGENKMKAEGVEMPSDALVVVSPVEKQAIDAELSVITVDTGVSASPPGGQSPVLFSRYIKPCTYDDQAGVGVCASPGLQEVTSNDSTGSLNEELSISISDQTQTSMTGDQQSGGLTADVPSTASVQTQSETCDNNVAKSRGDPDVSTPSLTGSTEEVDTAVTAEKASGSDISDVTDTTPSPVLVTFDVPAAEEHIHNQRGTPSDSTQQREDTAETSSPKSPTPQTVFGIDRTDMGTSKAEHRKVDLQPCTVETARSDHVNRTVDADRQISGEPVCSSAPRSRLLDAAVVTNSLFSVDRTVQVDGDSSKAASIQVQSSGTQCVETEALADMSPKKPRGDSPYQATESQIDDPSKTQSAAVPSDVLPSAQQMHLGRTVTDANKTATGETPAKDHTGKSTNATKVTQSVHARPSKSGSAKKARNVKGKQLRKLRNSLDSIPAAQRMAKSKRPPSESLAQSAQNLSVESAETSKGTVTDMSKVTTTDTTSDIPASRTVVTAQGRTASPKSMHSTELKTSVSPSAVKTDNESETTKEASTKTDASVGGESDIQQMVTKYQAIKHLIENGGSDVAVEYQQEGDSKPSLHVTNIRMGDRITVAGRGRTSRQPSSAPSRTQSAPAREGSREEKEEGNNDQDAASQKDQAVETDFAETVYDDELERLRRERQRILYMLEKDVVPSKLQVELAEAQLNYIIGQTDTLLQALEEPWDSESLMAYTAHDEQLQNISREYLSKYRTTLEQSRVDIEQRIVELEQNAATKPEQSRVNQRILLEKERRKAVESFKRERQLEQVNFELMRETLRSRSLSPTDGSVQSDRWAHTMSASAGRGRARNTQSSAMTPKQRREYLVGLRKGIVKTTKDTSSPAVSVSSGSPQITPRAISVLSPPFRSHSAGRAASHASDISHPPGFTMHHGNRMRSYSPAPGRRMNLPYASQSHRSSNIPSSYEAMDASSITSSIDEDSMRLLDDYQATRGRTHIEIERAREILQSGAGLHASRPSAVRTSTM